MTTELISKTFTTFEIELKETCFSDFNYSPELNKILNALKYDILSGTQCGRFDFEHITTIAPDIGATAVFSFNLLKQSEPFTVPTPTTPTTSLTWEQLAASISEQIDTLPTNQIPLLTTQNIAALNDFELSIIRPYQIAALTPVQVHALTTHQLQVMSSGQIAALTTAQIPALLSHEIIGLTTSDVISNLTGGVDTGLELDHLEVTMTLGQVQTGIFTSSETNIDKIVNLFKHQSPIYLGIINNFPLTLEALDLVGIKQFTPTGFKLINDENAGNFIIIKTLWSDKVGLDIQLKIGYQPSNIHPPT